MGKALAVHTRRPELGSQQGVVVCTGTLIVVGWSQKPEDPRDLQAGQQG